MDDEEDFLHHRRDSDTDASHGGWLCPTEEDRARLVDMSPAVKRARQRVAIVLGLGVLAIVPWDGWIPTLLFLGAAAPLLYMDRFMVRSRRPERIAAGVQLLNFLLIVTGVAFTHGVHSPVLSWIVFPIMAAAARFRPRVFVGAVALTALITLAVLFGISAQALLHDPAPAIGVCALLAGLVVLQPPVLDAEHRWRHDAVLDSLTGLLNRQGLDRRFAELAEQARVVGAPVSLVVFDVDRFKAVNDTHGHARGDDVLTGVADTLRGQLRSFELLYRLGGDELLLLLPGADRATALSVAEQARLAVQTSRPGGLAVTVSIGVSTANGGEIRLGDMFEAADRSLYEAKRAGRNAVHLAQEPGAEPGGVPQPAAAGEHADPVSTTA
jgi:diguanylate cyclase (GGDEF)-like protein